jgi:hypothetical protein
MHRSLVVSVLAAALGGSGCSNGPAAPADATQADASPSGYTSPPDGNGMLTPTPGFPGRTRPLGSAYRTRTMGVLAASDGSVWATHADETETPLEERALIVERFDPSLGTGAIVARATIRPARPSPNRLDRVALCSHPSGEVTLAVFASTAGPETAALMVTRFAADGNIVRTAYIDDEGAPVVDGHAAYRYGNHLDCVSDGEGLFLVASTLDLRLYRLTPELNVQWSRPVMPLTPNLLNQRFFDDGRVVIANDHAGGAVTAMTLWSEDRAAFAASFGTALPPTSGAADVLVTRFGADGTRGPAGLLGGPGLEFVRGVRADGDRVSVLTQMTVPATHDIDIVLLAGDPAQGHTEEAVEINLCQEDEVFDVIPGPGDGFVVAGGACATPGDTSTRVGFVATLGPDGRRQGVTWFTSPRDTLVEAVAPAAGGVLALAGHRNGPTTAPGESVSNEGWLGIVAVPASL